MSRRARAARASRGRAIPSDPPAVQRRCVMKALTSKIVVLALACGVALLPLAARAASLDQEFDCEKWNGGKELRCLFNDGRGGPTAIVKVGNSGKEKVSFD